MNIDMTGIPFTGFPMKQQAVPASDLLKRSGEKPAN